MQMDKRTAAREFRAGRLDIIAQIRFKFGAEHLPDILMPTVIYAMDDEHGATIYTEIK